MQKGAGMDMITGEEERERITRAVAWEKGLVNDPARDQFSGNSRRVICCLDSRLISLT